MDYSSPTQVKVKALSGNTYIASYVISTLPLGVMQKNVVAWTPSLPAAKVRSTCMRMLHMGSLLNGPQGFPRANRWTVDVCFHTSLPPPQPTTRSKPCI